MSWIERQFLQECLLSNTPICQISPSLRDEPFQQIAPLLDFMAVDKTRQDVTVVIPTHRQVPLGLEAWREQTDQILVLQNGGFTHPIEGVRSESVTWIGHGATRQYAVSMVNTPYLFFTVDDAIPLGGMLDQLVHHLQHSTDDAVVARQVPFPNAAAKTRRDLFQWTPPAEHPYLISQTDHVGTLYRTDDLIRDPIPAVPIAEDVHWSEGKQVSCVPSAVIVHSHPRCWRTLAQREFAIHCELTQLGLSEPIELVEAIRGGLSAIPQYGVREGVRTVAQNLARFAAQRVARHPKP